MKVEVRILTERKGRPVRKELNKVGSVIVRFIADLTEKKEVCDYLKD